MHDVMDPLRLGYVYGSQSPPQVSGNMANQDKVGFFREGALKRQDCSITQVSHKAQKQSEGMTKQLATRL